MDNLTHSLVGAALAEVACRSQGERRLFLVAGVVASNFPDLDLVYTGVTPEPLGYLLHHRGHTHTVAGLVAQALLIAALCMAPPLRRAVRAAGARRFWALVAACLACHLVLDSWNVYGVHPFWPVDSRWYYGDAIFIFEPWVWLLLGTAAAANARTSLGRAALAVLVGGLLAALTAAGVLPVAALAALLAMGFVVAWWFRDRAPRTRALAALGATVVFVAGMFGLAAVARARARAAVGADPRGRIVDVVVNPNPGWPLCWALIAIESDPAGDLVLRRGTISLRPAWQAPGECPSHRLEGFRGTPARDAVAWAGELRQPLDALRALGGRDCWVRAWLQFGRAPFVRDGTIADLRFESGRGNFTAMAIPGEDRACPPAMTSWGLPRADVLSR